MIPSQRPDERLEYTVTVGKSLRRLQVELCPRGFGIERLNEPSPDAHRLLDRGVLVTPRGERACASDGVELQMRDGECVRYAVTLPKQSGLASPDDWLWVPSPRPEGVKLSVRFELPDGVSAAMPWAEGAPPESLFAWKSAGAFTRRAIESAPPLRLAVLAPGFRHEAEVRAWIEQGKRTASLLFGRFPVPEALVIAVPGKRRGAGFGMALRGGGPSVLIFLDRESNAATLANDWTATHEFLHLGVPRLPPDDAWLFEGLATYYTEVLRARAGLITRAQAYQHLLDGFERGRRSGGTLSLREESQEMRERRSFHRVYWAGAALALLVDVEARRAGGPTLDHALRDFAECCASSSEDWSAERVLSHLDQTLGAPRFSTLARAWLDRADFPALDETWRALGVAPGKRGEALLTPAADSALRDALVALPTEPQAEPEQREKAGKNTEDQ